jgi:hypothetical protein
VRDVLSKTPANVQLRKVSRAGAQRRTPTSNTENPSSLKLRRDREFGKFALLRFVPENVFVITPINEKIHHAIRISAKEDATLNPFAEEEIAAFWK